jgi:2-hydroxycyclohexanecarboxyl-CoA dehydrogenase
MSLENRVAVVTGGGSGIGRACSIQLARDGAAVAVWDLNAKNAADTVRLVQSAGGKAAAYVGDATDLGAISQTLAAIRADLGPVLILVNNAGISQFKSFLEVTQEDLESIYRINVFGPFLLTQASVPDMLTAGWGRIIFISSSSAQTGTALQPHYASSKGGIISLSRSLAQAFADQGITVNNVSPGFIDTPMMRAAPVDSEVIAQTSPMKRAGRPEELAAAVSFLASQQASYVTGQTMGVNGGRVPS